MRHISLSFLIFLFVGMSLMGCEQAPKESGAMSDEAAKIAVEVQTIGTSDFTRTRAYVGNVSASKSVKVIPLTSEQILKFDWENGEYIEKGEVVAEIRNSVSKKGIEALNAQMKSIDAQLGAAQRELKRVQSMYESNIVSRQQYDQAQDAVTTYQASKMQLQASLEQSRMGADYARVVAPISGVISQKNSEVGDVASSAMPLCVILQMNLLKVTLNVNEADVVHLSLDQKIKLRFAAYPGEVVTATIKRIMPYVNMTTRTNVVEAEFENICLHQVEDKCVNGEYKYKPGMYVRAEVGLKTTENAVVVPPTALLLDPDLLASKVPGETKRRAFIVKDDMTVEARDVIVGEQNGNIIEILGGLKPGEKLVTRGQHSLRNGDRVTIKNTSNMSDTTGGAAPEKEIKVEAGMADPEAVGADAAAPEANENPAEDAAKAAEDAAKAAETPSAEAVPAAEAKGSDKAAKAGKK